MIKLPLYSTTIRIQIFKNRKDLKKYYNKQSKKLKFKKCEKDLYIKGCVINKGSNLQLLFNKEDMEINTITHEIYHLTNKILYNNGVIIEYEGENTDENHAILNGFLNQEVFKYFKKNKCKVEFT